MRKNLLKRISLPHNKQSPVFGCCRRAMFHSGLMDWVYRMDGNGSVDVDVDADGWRIILDILQKRNEMKKTYAWQKHKIDNN